MRIGIIGAGHMGTLHTHRLTTMGHTVLTSDPYKPSDYPDPAVLLIQGLDGVVIASPSEYHADHAKLAFSEGVPMLIEKPVATSSRDADELVRIAKESGIPAMVGHIERFNPVIRDLPYIVQEEARVLVAVRSGPRPSAVPKTGIAYDLLPHDIDLAALILGPIETAHPLGLGDDPNYAGVQMVHHSGRRSCVVAHWGGDLKERKIQVFTHEKTYIIDLIEKTVSLPHTAAFYRSYEEPLVNELKEFLKMIRGDRSSPVTIEDAAVTIRIIETVIHRGEKWTA